MVKHASKKEKNRTFFIVAVSPVGFGNERLFVSFCEWSDELNQNQLRFSMGSKKPLELTLQQALAVCALINAPDTGADPLIYEVKEDGN